LLVRIFHALLDGRLLLVGGMTRGEEMMFAWVSAWAATAEVDDEIAARMPRANEPAGLLTAG